MIPWELVVLPRKVPRQVRHYVIDLKGGTLRVVAKTSIIARNAAKNTSTATANRRQLHHHDLKCGFAGTFGSALLVKRWVSHEPCEVPVRRIADFAIGLFFCEQLFYIVSHSSLVRSRMVVVTRRKEWF